MKRIDDKISEIKTTHKRNRILFIAFVVLIMAFMAVVFRYESKLAAQNEILLATNIELDDKNNALDSTNAELEVKNKELIETNDALTKSLRPEEYWDIVTTENTAQAYILYLTKELGIDKPNEQDAIDKIKMPGVKGKAGWIYVGKMVNGIYTPKYANVAWRKDSGGDLLNSKPLENDVIAVKGGANRTTYRSSNVSGAKNVQGWRVGTKAFVTKVEQNGIEVKVKILYY